jgi:ankyrin repeat protein
LAPYCLLIGAGDSPLHLVADNGDEEIVEALLQAGADVNLQV